MVVAGMQLLPSGFERLTLPLAWVYNGRTGQPDENVIALHLWFYVSSGFVNVREKESPGSLVPPLA
jgi:hypothetical protein